LKGNPLTNLSVEQIVDCDANYETQNADCGVYGGWPYLAFKYLISAGGLASEAAYPYCGGMPSCSPCEAPGYMEKLCGPPIPYCLLKDSCQAKFNTTKFVPNLKLVDWKAISENETEIAIATKELGPMSVALNAELLQFYSKGIFDPIKCDPKRLDHGNSSQMTAYIP
jgi:cathepsin F